MRLSDFFEKFKDLPYAIDENFNSINYGEVIKFAKAIKGHFANKKLVFHFWSYTLCSLVGYGGFLCLDATNLLLTENTLLPQLHSLVEAYNPNFIWLPSEKEGILPDNANVIYRYRDYSLAMLHKKDLNLYPSLSVLLSTSGSTGIAKLVKLSDENLLANAISISEYLDINSSDKPITSLPMNYSFGLSVINSHTIKGATILLTTKSVVQMDFWSFFKKAEATSLSGVPYTYELLVKMRFERMKLPSLKVMTQAGGRLSIDLTEKFYKLSQEKGFKFYVMYGQTEATARMSYVPLRSMPEKIGSIGKAIPGGNFSLVDNNHTEIKNPKIEGELVYEGPNVFGGYALSTNDLAFLSHENKLYTGDIAYRDEDGFFYITGRMKRFVKIFGNRISLDAVEQILKEKIKEVACTGDDEQIRIYHELDVNFDIVELLSERLHLFPSVFQVIKVNELPKNEAGKIQYSKLK